MGGPQTWQSTEQSLTAACDSHHIWIAGDNREIDRHEISMCFWTSGGDAMPRTAKNTAATSGPSISARAVERTLEVIGGKWTVQILRDLFEGTRRFGQLQQSLGGVSPKMLIARLRELEERGLVTRTLYPEIPPRVEYSLTDDGRTLRPIVDAMADWGRTHGEHVGFDRNQRDARDHAAANEPPTVRAHGRSAAAS
jgi:DNA-binding HxlR family transcriptional regulator